VNVKTNIWRYPIYGLVTLLCLGSVDLCARTKIAILDFELKDLTLAPRLPEEIKRTASIKPLLEKAGYGIVSIDHASQGGAQTVVLDICLLITMLRQNWENNLVLIMY